MTTEIMLKEVRMAFSDSLVAAEAFPGSTKKRHSATALIVPGSDNDRIVQAAILAELQAGWPKTWQAMLESFKGNSNKYCYVKGDTKSQYEGFPGNMALSMHRGEDKGMPLLLGADIDDRTGRLRVLTGKEGVLYPGCYINVKAEIWAQVKDYPGIRCGLLTIQYAKEGDAFSGGARPSDDGFGPLAAGADAPAAVGAGASLV